VLRLRELKERLRVREGAVQLVELVDLALEARLLLRQRLRLAVVVPEVLLQREVGDLVDPARFDR
jgi:hypothetical protein